jgi:type III restriction enzyme
MELKHFQKRILDELARFLALIPEKRSIAEAFRASWAERDVAVEMGKVKAYRENGLPGVPNVCIKVPTGGGKTFIASAALKVLFDHMNAAQTHAAVWLVPSDTILRQTLQNLKNTRHPYRQRIDADFSHRVTVYSKEELLSGQQFSPEVVKAQLSVFVLSYDSFRTNKKDGRKAYQENGNLADFPAAFGDADAVLAGVDETALINAIRALNPVVVVDESHHAQSTLSREMLTNFNPSFVLDLTATPTDKSNIVAIASALELKTANMVKLPVIVHNLHATPDVIVEAISARRNLEAQAKREQAATGRYIRPIALFQAEPKNKDDSETFEKIKKRLLELEIPAAQIAIKTANVDELKNIDLLSAECPIRFIITVNALKEGWDCPFAYILATVANRSSVVDVEQILGRILRLPNTQKCQSSYLNLSYCLTSSADFHRTLDKVVAGLNSAGYSKADYRVSTETPAIAPPQMPAVQVGMGEATAEMDVDLGDIETVKERLAALQEAAENGADDMAAIPLFATALEQGEAYNAAAQDSANSGYYSMREELGGGMNTFKMNGAFSAEARALRLPQFVRKNDHAMPEWFGGGDIELVSQENLLEDFSLLGKDSTIDFTAVDAEMARVDIEGEGEALPRALRMSATDARLLREFLGTLTPEARLNQCRGIIEKILNKDDSLDTAGLKEFVSRVIASLTPEQVVDLQQSPEMYALKIRKKIDALKDEYRANTFKKRREQGKIFCEGRYALPPEITPIHYTTTYGKSLYEAEEEMNGLEKDIVAAMTTLPNIKWWHRNRAKTGFCINGFVNAYPDILAMTQGGMILAVEAKGEQLGNDDSRRKAENGRAWANAANQISGDKYRYYMVFRDREMPVDGAVNLAEFMEYVRGM